MNDMLYARQHGCSNKTVLNEARNRIKNRYCASGDVPSIPYDGVVIAEPVGTSWRFRRRRAPSSSSFLPAALRIANATPPPCESDELAALTMALAGSFSMSPQYTLTSNRPMRVFASRFNPAWAEGSGTSAPWASESLGRRLVGGEVLIEAMACGAGS
jgi:hypothetical protein